MDFDLAPADVAFRDELRAWLDEHLPKFLADWGSDEDAAAAGKASGIERSQERRRDWQRRLHDGRWAAINWPKEWGGREATPIQNVIYSEEMARVRAPGIYNACSFTVGKHATVTARDSDAGTRNGAVIVFTGSALRPARPMRYRGIFNEHRIRFAQENARFGRGVGYSTAEASLVSGCITIRWFRINWGIQ